jgi:hypothetical protein
LFYTIVKGVKFNLQGLLHYSLINLVCGPNLRERFRKIHHLIQQTERLFNTIWKKLNRLSKSDGLEKLDTLLPAYNYYIVKGYYN